RLLEERSWSALLLRRTQQTVGLSQVRCVSLVGANDLSCFRRQGMGCDGAALIRSFCPPAPRPAGSSRRSLHAAQAHQRRPLRQRGDQRRCRASRIQRHRNESFALDTLPGGSVEAADFRDSLETWRISLYSYLSTPAIARRGCKRLSPPSQSSKN